MSVQLEGADGPVVGTPDTDSIYLDYQATTPVDPRVLAELMPFFERDFGNPSSRHSFGTAAALGVSRSRSSIRRLVGAKTDSEIVFTSGATESNTLALLGCLGLSPETPGHLVTTAIEHASILATVRQLEAIGHRVTVVPVTRDGIVDPGDVADSITDQTRLISVIHANNEIGTVQPIRAIADIARRHGIPMHSDLTQSAAYLNVDVGTLGLDLASLSSHKLYGPKGSGALYVRGGTRLDALIRGGGQESGMRAGTPNVPAIVGFGAAARLSTECRGSEAKTVARIRGLFLAELGSQVPGVRINGAMTERLPGNLSLTIPGVEADEVLRAAPGLAMSTGSACAAGDPWPSHVLTAIGLDPVSARQTLRVGFGRFTEASDAVRAAQRLADAVSHARRRAQAVATGD